MRKGGGKQKGASFEREICVMLSKWLSKGTLEDLFWRSAMSGGRATVAFAKGKKLGTQVGDITCIHPLGARLTDTFAIECKFYANLDYQGLLTGKGKLLSFWNEINSQAGRYEKLPFLVCRQNRMKAHVCLDKAGMTKLSLHTARTLLISIPHDLYMLDADKFIEVCEPFVNYKPEAWSSKC